jgi:hypothetical protein
VPEIQRFRKKPTVTAMIRWDGTDEARRLIAEHSGKPVPADTRQGALSVWVQKSAAWMWLPLGDWAALEADGTGIYPLAEDVRLASYETADAARGVLDEPCKPCGCLSFGEDCDECRTDPVAPPS